MPWTICAIFRNEAPYLREWLEFHLLQGAERVYLYNNRSDDDFLSVLAPYLADGVVRLIEWSLDKPLPQSVDEVDDLTRPIYQVLTTEAAKLNLNEDFSLEGAQDPKAPTEDSGDSSPSSEEQPS